MPFNNNINYAAVFNRILDEKFYILPRTMWMENTTPGIQWTGGKDIKVPYMEMDGLGDMQNCKAPDGSITLDWENKTLEYYRGRNFSICTYEPDMTNFALTAENALRVFLNEHVIPEMDMIRISRAAQAAVNYGVNVVGQASSGITPDNILTLLMADIAKVQDQIGETEQLYVQISTQLKNTLTMSSQITRFLNMRDFSINSANLKIEALNDQYIIGTPSSYMKSAFRLNDGRSEGQVVGGVSFVNTAPGVNWIIASRRAIDAVSRPRVTKVITPDVNQEGEFFKIMFSIFHGVWTYRQKANGLLVNMDTTLGTLNVKSVSAGSGATTITVNATPTTDVVLMYKVSGSEETVTFGTPVKATDGWAVLPADGTVAATNAQTITVALVGATSGLPMSKGKATVVAGV